ncbi:MAG: hypothetical protein HOO96_26090 [Polyangiaceae bacterium]|nr:hypothetical protein [Polyangiaceae bacterium]
MIRKPPPDLEQVRVAHRQERARLSLYVVNDRMASTAPRWPSAAAGAAPQEGE